MRLFRVLLPRRRHSENLACDAVCPMGLSRAIARRATLSKRGNSRGRYDRVPSASNFANARSTLRATRWTPAFSGAACFKNTPRLTLGLQPSYTEPDASTARPETTAVWVARRVRGPWHADGGTLECVLFNVGGRATGAVGRRARIASDGAGDGDAPFSMARQTFSRRTREIYPRNVCFWRKLGKNQTNCSYATAFSEIVKIPLKAKGGIGRGTRGMFLLVPRRRSSNNSANCLVGFFSCGIREFP